MLDAARGEFARTGLLATTIEQVAATAGVTRQSVYEQFDDKQALFDAALASTIGAARVIVERLESAHDSRAKNWALHRYTSKFQFELGYPEHARLIREGGRMRHPAVIEYRRWEYERDAEALRRYWAHRGDDMAEGRMPEILASVAPSLVRAMLEMQWETERPDPETMAELLALFSAGGVRSLVRHAPNVITALS